MAQSFERIVNRACKGLNVVATALLFLLMIQGAADVIARYFFNAPIIGTMERGQVLMALMVFFGWGYTQIQKGHVTVELFITRFPPRARAITNFITTVLSLILFVLIVWQGTVAAIDTHKAGELIYVIHWPLAPFQLVVPLGAFFLCLILILELVKSISRGKERV
jgi:TRAP-type C4-dicarboxylate transport system permease small subunit